MADRCAQPRHEEPRRNAAFIEQDPDRKSAPSLDELGAEYGLAVSAGGLDDDDMLRQATICQSFTAMW